jgi:hypothetical protein
MEFTTLFNLYKWAKKDKKNDTISEMAKNADKIEAVLGPISKRAIYVNEAPFNVKGDGTDETVKLQQAVSALPATGGILVFPAGYTFKHRAQLDFSGKQRVTVFGYGAVLESFTDTPVVPGFGNLWFKDASIIYIFGLEIKANGRSRLSVSTPAPSIENSAITVMNCNHVWTRDVIISEAVNDAIFSGGNPADPYSDNVLIENITIDWARRNGVSFNRNTNSRVVGGTIKNIGYNKATGLLDPLAVHPMAGVDSENTSATGINRNIRVSGVTFIDNYIDIEFYGGHEDSSIHDVTLSSTGNTTFALFGIVLQGKRDINPNYISKGVVVSKAKIKKRTTGGSIYLDQVDDTVIDDNTVNGLDGGTIIETATCKRSNIKGNVCKKGFISVEGLDTIYKSNTLDEYSSATGFGVFLTATVKQASDNTVIVTSAGATGYQCADPTKTMFVNNMFMGPGTSVYNYVNRTKEDIVMGTSTFIKRLIS